MKKLVIALFLALTVIGFPSSVMAKGYSGGGSHSVGGGSHSISSGGGGSHSFGGGASSVRAPSPSPSRSVSSYKPSVSSSAAPSGHSYSDSGSGDKGTTGSNSSSPSAKPKSTYDSGAAYAMKQQASKDAYVASQKTTYKPADAPKPSYTTPSGVSKPLPYKDPEVSYLKGRLDGEHYANRSARRDTFYSSYHPETVVIHHYDNYYSRRYSDPYDNDFIYHWLVLQSLETQSQWLYNHQANMDQARLNDLYAQNAALRTQVATMQTNHIVVNATYVPPGVDPDLAYTDDYVRSVANVTPVVETTYYPPVETVPADMPVVVVHHHHTSGGAILLIIIGMFAAFVVIWGVVALLNN